jgi:hypothetical protein
MRPIGISISIRSKGIKGQICHQYPRALQSRKTGNSSSNYLPSLERASELRFRAPRGSQDSTSGKVLALGMENI